MNNKKEMLILVVDDEPILREIIALNIADEGYSVLEASGAFEALEIIEKNKIHFVITDMQMPNGSGEDLLRTLAQREERPEILLVTGFAKLSRDEAIELGARDMLTKPVKQNLINTHAQAIFDSL